MFLQSKNDDVVLLGLAGFLLCLMQGVPCVGARFTFELDLQSSSTTGSCDTFDISPGCETYLRFCLRRSTSERSRNIDDCPLGSHGRVDENTLPSTVSISSNSAWPGSFQLYIKAQDDDSPLPPQDLDFIFINNMLQPLQGYSSSSMVTGDNRRVTVTLRYRVRCQDGYYGQDCNSVCGANQQCYSNGTRECVSGWQSPNTGCNTPICRTGCHPIGGNCSAPFQCQCNEGWRGVLCDQCIPAAGCSEVGGFCEVPGQCLCREGFGPSGVCNESTSAALNACMSSPCANGSTCTPDPDSGSYTCHCPPGYTGPSCDTNIDECMEASCPENSTCEDGINAFRCVCDTGYEGPNCTTTASNDQDPISINASSTTIILAVSVPSGVVVIVILLIVMAICVIALRRKRETLKGSGSSNRVTPAIPLGSQSSTENNVIEGLDPVYYCSVNNGNHINELPSEYDYIPANVDPVPMAANPAYQSTSFPSRSSGAILNTANDPVPMAANPAYQSTSFPSRSSGAILNTVSDPVSMAANPAYQSTSFPSRSSGASATNSSYDMDSQRRSHLT